MHSQSGCPLSRRALHVHQAVQRPACKWAQIAVRCKLLEISLEEERECKTCVRNVGKKWMSACLFYANENNWDKHYKGLTQSGCLFDVLMQWWDTCETCSCKFYPWILSLRVLSYCQPNSLSSTVKLLYSEITVKSFARIAKSETETTDLSLSPPILPFDCEAFHITSFCPLRKVCFLSSERIHSFSRQCLAIFNFIDLFRGLSEDVERTEKDSIDMWVWELSLF